MGYGIHNHRLLVAGCSSNTDKYLPAILRNIEEITVCFADHKVVIVESDSSDNTGRNLQQWASKNPGSRIIMRLGNLKHRIPSRTQRIAYCRNQYLEYFEKNDLYKKYDLLLVMDMDERCIEPINMRGLLSCFMPQRMNEWDALTANRRHEYYDIWALRTKGWCDSDCWQQVTDRPSGMTREEAVRRYVVDRKIHLPRDIDWIKCSSAFGGMAMYKTVHLPGCRYHGKNESSKSEKCEHVEFHRQFLGKSGTLFINPRFISG
jgi:glycosyltransferase involved in cell wall biosynthesis